MIDRVQWSTGAAAGSAGSATATGYSPHVQGEVMAVHVAYLDSPPATTDVTISDESDPDGEAIFTSTNNNADVKKYPRANAHKSGGAAYTYDGTNAVPIPFVVHGRLKAAIAGANSGDSATVTVWLKR